MIISQVGQVGEQVSLPKFDSSVRVRIERWRSVSEPDHYFAYAVVDGISNVPRPVWTVAFLLFVIPRVLHYPSSATCFASPLPRHLRSRGSLVLPTTGNNPVRVACAPAVAAVATTPVAAVPAAAAAVTGTLAITVVAADVATAGGAVTTEITVRNRFSHRHRRQCRYHRGIRPPLSPTLSREGTCAPLPPLPPSSSWWSI